MSGWVYILSNPTMPGLFKIGYTERDPISRAKEISDSTGVPLPYEVEYNIYTTHPRQVEQYTHRLLERFRINKSREFFKCSYEEIVEAIRETIKHYDTKYTDFSATGEMSYKILKEEIDRKIQEKLEKEWQREIQQERYRIAKQQEEKERLQRQKEQAEKERLQRQKEQAEKEWQRKIQQDRYRIAKQQEEKEKIAKIRKQESDEINKLLAKLDKGPGILNYIVTNESLFIIFLLLPLVWVLSEKGETHYMYTNHPIITLIIIFSLIIRLIFMFENVNNTYKSEIEKEIKKVKGKYQTMINQIKPN